MGDPEIKEVDGMAGQVCHVDKEPCLTGLDGGKKCGQYRFILGTDFQTGEPIRRWDCSLANQQLMQGEQSKHTRGMSEDLHALKQNLHIFTETLLIAANRPDLLEQMRGRVNHVNALTRTDDIQRRNRVEKIPH